MHPCSGENTEEVQTFEIAVLHLKSDLMSAEGEPRGQTMSSNCFPVSPSFDMDIVIREWSIFSWRLVVDQNFDVSLLDELPPFNKLSILHD